MLILAWCCPSARAQGLSVSLSRIATSGDTLMFNDGVLRVANFPYPVLTGSISVVDSALGEPVTGLADTTRWLSRQALKNHWPALRETIAGPRGATIEADLYRQPRGPWIREVTRLQARPTSTMLVVDISTSIKPDTLRNVKIGLTNFVEGMRDNIDRAGLMGFHAALVDTFSNFTFSKPVLRSLIVNAVKGEKKNKGTPLYRALRDALNLSRDESPARLRSIIVYTDGGNNDKGETVTDEDVVALANSMAIPIHTIWLGTLKNDTNIEDQRILKSIAHRTSGHFLQTRDGQNFGEIYDNLSRSQQHYYTMAHFAPEACGDSSMRQIEVVADDGSKSGRDTAGYRVNLPFRESDLAVTRPSAATRVTAGDTLHQSFMITNRGPSTAIFVDVQDRFPDAFLKYIAGSASVAPDSVTAGALYWSFDSLASGVSREIVYNLVADLDSSQTGAITVSDVAVVEAVCDPDSGNNSSVQQITITSRTESGLQLQLTAAPDSVAQGEFFAFRLVVENLGTAGAGAFSVTQAIGNFDRLRDFVFPKTPDAIDGASLTWNFDTLAVGQTDTLGFSARVPTCPMQTEPFLTITVTATVELADGTSVDQAADEVVSTSRECLTANLSLRMAANPSEVRQGEPLTLSFQVANASSFDAAAFSVFDALPPELNALASNIAPVTALSADTLQWDFTGLAADSSVTIELTVEAPCLLPLSNFPVELLSSSWLVVAEDADVGDNSSSAAVTVTGDCSGPNIRYDLQIAKRVDPDTAYFGQSIRYRLVVSNAGPQSANNFEVWDLPPAELQLSQFSPEPVDLAGDTLRWRFITLAPHDSLTIDYRAIWAGGRSTTPDLKLINLTSVDGARDTDATNNQAAAQVVLTELIGCQDGILLDQNVFQPAGGQSLDIRTKAQAVRSSIDIYDITGYPVRRLTGGAAQNSFQWDGRTDDGGQAGSGVYLILLHGKLADGTAIECKQHVLLVR